MKIEEKNGEFVVTDFDEMEAYRIAVTIEKEGVRFYKKFLDCVHNFQAQNALEILIEEEKKHIKFFEDSLDVLREEKEDLSEEDDLLNSMDFGLFHPLDSLDDACKVVDDDPKKIFQLGVNIEHRSIGFYQMCLYNVSSEDTKKELQKIIDEEKGHKELLENFMQQ